MTATAGEPPTPARSPERPPELPPGYRLVVREAVASTNDEARSLVRAGAAENTIVWAREQLEGRGRRGRPWASPPGNLYLSLILRPKRDLATAGQIGFVAAVALREAASTVLPRSRQVNVKWPNDVLVDGRKISGLLLESVLDESNRLDALILGLGVNIAHHPDDAAYPATNLRAAGAPPDLRPEGFLETFARSIHDWKERWETKGFEPIRAAWLSHARGRGEEIEVRLPSETLRGIFRDVDSTGALVLERAGGQVQSITVGDVFFGR